MLITGLWVSAAMAQRPVRMGPASDAEIKSARASLDSDFNSVKAHRQYIYAMGLINPLLEAQYKKWCEEYPQNIIIPLTIGTVYFNAEMPQAKEFLLKAAAIQPNNAKIWSMLSGDAFTRGEKSQAIEYLKKAALADTLNISYSTGILSYQSDSPAYAQKVFAFVKRFPASEQGAQVLYWLAERDTNVTEKINYFKQLHDLYPPQKYRWSAAGMVPLVDYYLRTEPEKAIPIIDEMPADKNWGFRKQAAAALIKVNQAEQEQNYKEALTQVNQIELPRFNYMGDFLLLRKAALLEKTGDVNAAYDSLVIKFAKAPTYELKNALYALGKNTGKTNGQITKEVETIRYKTASPAYPFNLGLYTGNGNLSLQNLKGKVILLTFWFPGCAPCREEFPYFEDVVNKFKHQNLEYIGIDVYPEQDPYVIPLLKNMHYSFTPLKGTSEFAAKYYGVEGEPTNFLIDKNGKIVFKDFRIDGTNEQSLELMISSLL